MVELLRLVFYGLASYTEEAVYHTVCYTVCSTHSMLDPRVFSGNCSMHCASRLLHCRTRKFYFRTAQTIFGPLCHCSYGDQVMEIQLWESSYGAS